MILALSSPSKVMTSFFWRASFIRTTPAEELSRDTTFESLHLDSLDTVEMLMDLESELGVDLELEEKVATIGELADFIESKLD